MAKKGKRRCDALPVLHPDTAGIDVGASELYVAASAERDPHPSAVSPLSLAICMYWPTGWDSAKFILSGQLVFPALADLEPALGDYALIETMRID